MLFSLQLLSEQCDLDYYVLYRAVRAGKIIPTTRIGRQYLFNAIASKKVKKWSEEYKRTIPLIV
jgi:hypothetical protein